MSIDEWRIMESLRSVVWNEQRPKRFQVSGFGCQKAKELKFELSEEEQAIKDYSAQIAEIVDDATTIQMLKCRI